MTSENDVERKDRERAIERLREQCQEIARAARDNGLALGKTWTRERAAYETIKSIVSENDAETTTLDPATPLADWLALEHPDLVAEHREDFSCGSRVAFWQGFADGVEEEWAELELHVER